MQDEGGVGWQGVGVEPQDEAKQAAGRAAAMGGAIPASRSAGFTSGVGAIEGDANDGACVGAAMRSGVCTLVTALPRCHRRTKAVEATAPPIY